MESLNKITMAFNWNHGWGKLIAESLTKSPRVGPIYIVAAASNVNYEELNEIFPATGDKSSVQTTLQAAIDQTTNNREGATIFVAPGHTENVTAAGGLDTGTDTAGLSIIGLGEANERALFTFTTDVAADFNIGSNGVTLDNLRWDLTGIDNLTAPFDINDTGFTMRNCDITTADSGGQTALALLTDANAGNMTLEDNRFLGTIDAGTATAIRIVGGDGTIIRRNYIVGAYTTTLGGIEVLTTPATNLLIENNTIRNVTLASTKAITLATQSSGAVVNNRLGILSGTTPIGVTAGDTSTGLTVGGNYFTNATSVTAGTLL